MEEHPELLIYGYGNPGLQDDGLGNAFVERMEDWCKKKNISRIEFDSNYQLNVEDAEAISHKDIVIFVDASMEPIEDFCLTRVTPAQSSIEFTMHAVSASYVLDLCNKLFDKNPDCYLMHIKGYEWDLKEGLSDKANENLEKTLAFLTEQLENPDGLVERLKGLVNG